MGTYNLPERGCKMSEDTTYIIEWNDDVLSHADYWALESYEYVAQEAGFVEDLMDYVQGMGYNWLDVAYVQEVNSATVYTL
jgi:hypothetical protein